MSAPDSRSHTGDFDQWLRRSSQGFSALVNTALVAYALLAPDIGENRVALLLTALAGYATIIAVAAFPWGRFHRNWYLLATAAALGSITFAVLLSGKYDSPLRSFYYLAAAFHVLYYRRRVSIPLNLLTLALCAAPIGVNMAEDEVIAYLLVYGVSFFVLVALVDATMQEIQRRERQIGDLVHQQRASERRTGRLAALQRVGLLVTSHQDTTEAMTAFARELAATPGHPCVSIHLADGDSLVAVATVGYLDSTVHERISPRGSTIGRVFESGISALTRDVSAWSDDQPPLPGIRSTASVPVREGEHVVGVLTVESREPLDTRDLESLELFAGQVGVALTNAHLYEEERRRATREEALREVALVLTASLDPNTVLDEVLDQLARMLHYDSAVMLTRGDDAMLQLVASRGPFGEDALFVARGLDVQHAHLRQESGGAGAQLPPAYFFSAPPEFDTTVFAAFPTWVGSLIAAPLVTDETLLGVILVATTQRGQYTQGDADLVADFARHAATALRNAELHDAVARSARTDALTGLLNHGAVLDTLGREIERSARYTHPLSLLFFDLDHFKTINDRYGHQFGDTLLRTLAQLAAETVRGADIVGRYGGEEFVAVLPETDYAEALHVAERLRARIAAHPLPAPADGEHLTVSVGVTTYPADGTTLDALIRGADIALYVAKHEGRNRVSGYRDVPTAASLPRG